MRYLFGGILSLLMLSCTAPSLDVCLNTGDTEEYRVVKTETRLEAQSRDATVKVMASSDGQIAVGTGTVYRYEGHNIVVTAAHVIGAPPYLVAVLTQYEYVMAEVVYFDSKMDLAVLVIPDVPGLSPMPFRPAPERSIKIGTDVLYSGFPNDGELFTIRGYITALHPSGEVYLHSYAWPGSSGSSVFDSRGRLIGVLVAIEVGSGIVGMPTAIEDVVLVIPISALNFDLLNFNIKELDV